MFCLIPTLGRWNVDEAGHKHGYICERPTKGENSGDKGTSEDVENNNNSGVNEATGNVEESGDIVDNKVTEDSGSGASNEDSGNNEGNAQSLVNEESKDTGTTVDGETGDGEEHDSAHEHEHIDNEIPTGTTPTPMDNEIPMARMGEDGKHI